MFFFLINLFRFRLTNVFYCFLKLVFFTFFFVFVVVFFVFLLAFLVIRSSVWTTILVILIIFL